MTTFRSIPDAKLLPAALRPLIKDYQDFQPRIDEARRAVHTLDDEDRATEAALADIETAAGVVGKSSTATLTRAITTAQDALANERATAKATLAALELAQGKAGDKICIEAAKHFDLERTRATVTAAADRIRALSEEIPPLAANAALELEISRWLGMAARTADSLPGAVVTWSFQPPTINVSVLPLSAGDRQALINPRGFMQLLAGRLDELAAAVR